MRHRRNWTAGRHLRRIRRGAGVLMAVLFLVANPSYGCTVDCLLHHHAPHVEHEDSGRHPHHDSPVAGQAGPMCHGSSLQSADQALARADLSPGRPARTEWTLALPSGTAPGAVAHAEMYRTFADIPPTPPPRA